MMKRTNPVARRVVSNFLREPAERRSFAQTLESCNAHNIDMASQHSSDFLLLQSKLFKYRIARLADECKYVAKHPFGSFPPFKQLLFHCAALPSLFVVAMWFGRYSTKPLIPPPQPEAPTAAENAATEATEEAAKTEDSVASVA